MLAGGVWSPAVGRTLGLKLPMQAGKGYSLTLAHPRQRPPGPSILVEARIAVTPMGDALRFGGTMEMAGSRPIDHARASGRDHRRRAAILSRIAVRDDFDGVRPWSGLRPCTPDGLPYLGRPRRFANLIVAAGHAMLGVSLAPITGQIVGQLIAGERPQSTWRSFRPIATADGRTH